MIVYGVISPVAISTKAARLLGKEGGGGLPPPELLGDFFDKNEADNCHRVTADLCQRVSKGSPLASKLFRWKRRRFYSYDKGRQSFDSPSGVGCAGSTPGHEDVSWRHRHERQPN
jgi:hypothetical protein